MGEYAGMHAAIMNMDPPEGPSDFGDRLDEQLDAAYKRGFRDARHAAAELALSAPAVPQWMPIETAPKDGSQFLIWTNRIWFAVVAHDQDDPMPTDIVPSGHHLKVDDGKFGPYPIRGDYPTHWMPLPAAPSAKEPPHV